MSITLLGGLTFVLVFAGSLLLHEIGHFLAGRLLRIEVEEFGIGFPPRIAKLFRWQGTDFTLNWLPLGGFNRFKGEDDPSIPGSLAAASPWKRIVVLLAGAFMNLLTAFFAFSLLYNQIGLPDSRSVVIVDVSKDSPAEAAGLQAGDKVLKVDGQEVNSVQGVRNYARTHLDQAIPLTIQRGDKTVELSITPLSSRTEQQGAMGVVLGNPLHPASSWFATLPYSFQSTYVGIGELLALPGRMIAGTVKPQEAQLAGPRSIWNLFQQAVARDVQSRQPSGTSQTARPTNYTLSVVISLTLSLGVLNLLPIPALDGGRIFMTLPEIFLRQRIPAKYQSMINGIGFLILITLLGFFYIKDILNPLAFNLP